MADILDYFKRDLSKVPSREKLEAQEPIARKEFKKAIDNEKKGKERGKVSRESKFESLLSPLTFPFPFPHPCLSP